MSERDQAAGLQYTRRELGRLMSQIESRDPAVNQTISALQERSWPGETIGITGPPGSGKSTLISALTRELRRRGHRVGVLAVDPSSVQTGGAFLGDRIRMMEHAGDADVVVRSIASRGRLGGLTPAVADHARLLRAAGYDRVLIETVGAGQAEIDIAAQCDLTLVVQAPGLGDDIQALKKGTLEIADLIVVNKSDLPGAAELQHQLGTWAIDPARVLLVSAKSGDGIDALLAAISERRTARPAQSDDRARREEIRALVMEQVRARLEERLAKLDLSTGNTWELADRIVAQLGDEGPTATDDERAWQDNVLAPFLAKAPERKATFSSGSGRPVPRLALPARLDRDYRAKLGFPGAYPFTRGVTPTMYRGRLWTFRQYSGFSTAAEANRRYRYLLEQGTTGLSVAFDLPTQLGMDSDDSLSTGEVGRVGVAIDTIADMEQLFAGIPLDRVSTSMTINATAPILLAMYAVVAERQGVPVTKIQGTLQNDILKEYIARGTYVFPPAPSLRLISDVIAWCRREAPGFNPISISGYHIREAGSTAVQEVAFTLANAITYIDTARAAGQRLEEFGPKLSFFFGVTTDLLEEAAKFRAARRLYARLIRERYRCEDPRCQMLRFHTQTAGHTLTAQQPHVNIVRVTIQALAAVLGGTQSLHTNSWDEALSLPTEDSARLALRTQQVIAHESGLGQTIDPLAGSYFIEQLTDEIEAGAEELIREIDRRGGMGQAIADGWVQNQIEDAAYRYQAEIEQGERLIIGVNHATTAEVAPPAGFTLASEAETRQRAALAEIRATRDADRVRSSLDRLAQAADSSENLMPFLLDAVRAFATIGEISGVLREKFGLYQPKD